MLILNRRKGESIRIADDVVVKVLRLRGGIVTLGIDAPRSVAVLRTELLHLVNEDGRATPLGRDRDHDVTGEVGES